MAIRQTRLLIKNNQVPNAPFSGATLLKGEAIVNTADGILMFSGSSLSTSEWTPAGTGGNASFFEVGSNLYDLRLRNRITKYEGQTGASLVGKFLSGTTNGFVLADISSIQGVDSYLTGATWNPNYLTLTSNEGKPAVSVLIDSFTGLSINGNLSVTGTETVNNLTITGTGLYNTLASGTNPNEIVNYSSLTSFTNTNDVYVTGSTLTQATNNTNSQSIQLSYHGTPIGGPYSLVTQNTFTTGGTYNSGTTSLDFKRNDGVTYSVNLSSIDINDTKVTGYTYNPSNNTFTIFDNDGNTYSAQFNTVSGLTVSNLTSGRVVYVGTNGLLTDEAGFTYNSGTDTLGVTNIESSGNVTIQGNLTVFGQAISAFTNELYVEDSNITLNYNPTGSTTITSVNAGLTIQDGNGISSGDVKLDIVRMENLTGLTSSLVPDVSEYTASTGYVNRGWITQLNDIVIRSTDTTDNGTPGSVNGVRVLGEGDVLDGGQY